MTELDVLVIGGGAREHAIGRALADGGARVSVVMSNENPGLARLAENTHIGPEKDPTAITSKAQEWGIEVAISGPEGPIAAGVTDALRDVGVRVASPSQKAGRVETDKAWMRRVMKKHGLPGRIEHRHFTHAQGLRSYIEELGEVAIKPIGLTGGKGVKVLGEHLESTDDALDYATEILTSGYGGGEVVVEEKLVGEEFTVQCFTDGDAVVPTPPIQDHKRAFEGDEGPNTGGMGSYSGEGGQLPFLNQEDYDQAVRIVQSIVDALDDEGAPYVGPIYGQFMLTEDGPKVIEVNARLGDPEAMNTLPVLETPLTELLDAMTRQRLDRVDVSFSDEATVCKYVVPRGYGTNPASDVHVTVDEDAIQGTGARLYYASCNAAEDGVTTTTSRTLAVVGIADTIQDANGQAEAALEHIDADEIYVRHDIGTEDLVTQRVAHMRALGRDPTDA